METFDVGSEMTFDVGSEMVEAVLLIEEDVAVEVALETFDVGSEMVEAVVLIEEDVALEVALETFDVGSEIEEDVDVGSEMVEAVVLIGNDDSDGNGVVLAWYRRLREYVAALQQPFFLRPALLAILSLVTIKFMK